MPFWLHYTFADLRFWCLQIQAMGDGARAEMAAGVYLPPTRFAPCHAPYKFPVSTGFVQGCTTSKPHHQSGTASQQLVMLGMITSLNCSVLCFFAVKETVKFPIILGFVHGCTTNNSQVQQISD